MDSEGNNNQEFIPLKVSIDIFEADDENKVSSKKDDGSYVRISDIREPRSLKYVDVNVNIGELNILNNAFGSIEGGEIMALMGPSGSGKSTLLNCLSFRKELIGRAKMTGKVLLNDKPLKKKNRYLIGYVMQEDLFFEDLTLFETIVFYSHLRLSKSISSAEKYQKAHDIIDKMQLSHALNTKIGGVAIRGLSGGERKRAGICCELITDPEILLLDEPTSGLDSSIAYSVINILKNLCVDTNKAVIASIHQPSSHIFFSFDKLALLSNGRMLYYGQLPLVVDFLSNIGFECPKNWNAADYIIDVARFELDSREKIYESCQNIIRDDFLKKFKNIEKINEIELKDDNKHNKKYHASSNVQFSWLFKRSFVRSVDETWSAIKIFELLAITFLIGVNWLQVPMLVSHFDSLLGLLFFIVLEVFADPFFNNVFTFESEKLVITRERMSSMYRLYVYYCAKVVSEMPILFTRPLIFMCISYWICGLNPSVWFIPFTIISMIGSLLGHSCGFFISSFGLSQKESLTFMVLYFVGCILFGGFYNRTLPIWLSWIRYITPTYLLYVLLLYFQFQGDVKLSCDTKSIFSSCINAIDISMNNNENSTTSYVSVDEIMQYIDFNIPIYYAAIILFSLLLINYIIAFLILRQTLKRSYNEINLFNFSFRRFMKIAKPKRSA